jgi:hypothetical protein
MRDTPDRAPDPQSRAASVAYVHRIASGPHVAGPDEPAGALAARIEARIEGRVRGRIYDLHVICSDGSIILRGRARTYYTKQLAQEAVLDLPGRDFPLVNEITVG